MQEGNWLLGTGPGSYAELTQGRDFSAISGGVEYLDPAGLPVINVFLEAANNAGIFAALVMLFWSVYVAKTLMHTKNAVERRLMLGASVALFLMLMFESSYLRAYVWITMGVFLARAKENTFEVRLHSSK